MKLLLIAFVLLTGPLASAQEPDSVSPAGSQEPESVPPDFVRDVDVRGNRSVRRDTILNYIQTVPGQELNPATVARDIRTLWNLPRSRFDNVRVETEPHPDGGIIVVFYVEEKPLVQTVYYEGNKSVSESDILMRFRELGIDLSPTTPYNPSTVNRAEAAILALEAEAGRLQATIDTQIDPLGTNAVIITFVVAEGPKIKIEEIEIAGNEIFSDSEVKKAMELLKETGPIVSFKGQDVFHPDKFAYDQEMIRQFYASRGYVRMNVVDTDVEARSVKISRTLPAIKPPFPWGIPLPFWKKDVDRHFIRIEVEENEQFRVGNVQVTGNTVFSDGQIQLALGLIPGTIYNEKILRDGIEGLTDLYGNFGYINYTAFPEQDIDDENRLVNVIVHVEEDRQFRVRRITFRGNTTTRDNVIRREILLAEGDVFNSQLWDLSLLRLNQLGYFEPIEEDAADLIVSPTDPEVDITLTVDERARNSIGLSGGVSGIGGSFLGINYATNNFLGLGETLSVALQGGTRYSNYSLSFTEPYLLGRSVTAGFSVFKSRYEYDQARDLFGLDPENLPQGLGFENRLNYEQSRTGFNFFSSYPMRNFQRVGLTFQFSNSETSAVNPATAAFFDSVQQSNEQRFIQNGGFSDFKIRSLIPMWIWNTVNNPNFPTNGQSISLNFEFSGGFLGGNTNFFRPMFEYRKYKPMNRGRNTLAFRFQTSYLQGFGGTSAPHFERFFMGGDFDIRGFDFRAVSPMAWVTRQTTDIFGRPVLFDDLAWVGGDTTALANVEYRIPLVSDIFTLAPFLDVGNAWVTRKNQLRRRIVDPDGTIHFESVRFVPGTNSGLRSSTGIELQMQLPVINAPFRVLYFYNPLRIDRTVVGPTSGSEFVFREDQKGFRFTIGRTF